MLNLHLPWARYRTAKARFDELKKVKADHKLELDKARLADRPYQEMLQCVLSDVLVLTLRLLQSRVAKLERTRKTSVERHVQLQKKLVDSTIALTKHVRRVYGAPR